MGDKPKEPERCPLCGKTKDEGMGDPCSYHFILGRSVHPFHKIPHGKDLD